MRLLVIAGLVWGLVAAPASIGDSQPKSPKEVVEEFWTFETNGGRLTADAEKAGLGFELPVEKPVVGPNGPRIENEVEMEMSVNV